MAAVVLAAEKNPVKTRIMFQSYLNIRALDRYLDELVEAGLLRLNSSSYFVTEKGRRFLLRFMKYSERCSRANKRLKDVVSEKAALESMLSKSGVR